MLKNEDLEIIEELIDNEDGSHYGRALEHLLNEYTLAIKACKKIRQAQRNGSNLDRFYDRQIDEIWDEIDYVLKKRSAEDSDLSDDEEEF